MTNQATKANKKISKNKVAVFLGPDNIPLFHGNLRKADYYVRNGYATVITEIPMILKINYVPDMTDWHTIDRMHVKNGYNVCSVCLFDKKITKHHLIPIDFYRYYPMTYRNYTDNFLNICKKCHERYNKKSIKFIEFISREIGIETPRKICFNLNRKRKLDAINGSIILIEKELCLDEQRKKKIISDIFKYTKKEVTRKMIYRLSKINKAIPSHERKEKEKFYKGAIDHYGLVGLAILWRQHFLDTMNPQLLPYGWTVEPSENHINKLTLVEEDMAVGYP